MDSVFSIFTSLELEYSLKRDSVVAGSCELYEYFNFANQQQSWRTTVDHVTVAHIWHIFFEQIKFMLSAQ